MRQVAKRKPARDVSNAVLTRLHARHVHISSVHDVLRRMRHYVEQEVGDRGAAYLRWFAVLVGEKIENL